MLSVASVAIAAAMGGAYLTLLNTIANMGVILPKTPLFAIMDKLTISSCRSKGGEMMSELSCPKKLRELDGKNACTDAGGCLLCVCVGGGVSWERGAWEEGRGCSGVLGHLDVLESTVLILLSLMGRTLVPKQVSAWCERYHGREAHGRRGGEDVQGYLAILMCWSRLSYDVE